jgi:hypothetical protein
MIVSAMALYLPSKGCAPARTILLTRRGSDLEQSELVSFSPQKQRVFLTPDRDTSGRSGRASEWKDLLNCHRFWLRSESQLIADVIEFIVGTGEIFSCREQQMVYFTKIDDGAHIESCAALAVYLARGLVKEFSTQYQIL